MCLYGKRLERARERKKCKYLTFKHSNGREGEKCVSDDNGHVVKNDQKFISDGKERERCVYYEYRELKAKERMRDCKSKSFNLFGYLQSDIVCPSVSQCVCDGCSLA